MTAGNDVVDLSKWNGSGSVNIGDAFSGDNDKVTVKADALNNLKLTSIENLEIVNSNPTTSVALNGTNFKGLEAIKLIGEATALDVSLLTQGVKIDATANADTITGSSKADTINGGAGNDIIVGNDGNDVLTGGNGADTFVVGNAKDFGVDQILDFSAEDKITMVTATTSNFSAQELKKFDASTFSTVTYKTLDSVLATFGKDGANETKPNDVVIFSYDGKTYALLANGPFSEATDALVDITGANVASLTESNFGGTTTIPTPPTPAPTVTTYDNYEAFVNAVMLDQISAGKQVAITTLTGLEAGLLAVNKTYLDKIVAGGIKNVSGDIVVTVGKTNDVSNDFNSTEFGTKLATSVIESGIVMKINGTDKTDDIVTTFGAEINGGSGDDMITAYAAATINGGSGDDVITANAAATINGGTENDTIYLKAGGSVDGGAGTDTIYVSGSGAATIKGDADIDTIDASAATGAVTIYGGADNDTIILGAGKDTVVFESTPGTNGEDEITGFTAGANGDKLAVGGATGLLGGNVVADPILEKAIVSSGVALTAKKNVIVITDKASLTTGDFQQNAAAGKIGTTNMTDGDKVFVVAYDNSATEANLYLVTITTANNGTVSVTSVGTVDATSGFVAGNFVDVA